MTMWRKFVHAHRYLRNLPPCAVRQGEPPHDAPELPVWLWQQTSDF